MFGDIPHIYWRIIISSVIQLIQKSLLKILLEFKIVFSEIR